MKLEKFLFEVFRTCLLEEEGSTEHITEHVTHEDVIEITKQLGLDDITKKFKRISKCSEEGEVHVGQCVRSGRVDSFSWYLPAGIESDAG
jgi:hypothetical protein